VKRVPRSIRFRVTALAVGVSLTLLGLVSVVLVLLLRWQLTDNLDENLSQRADTIAESISDDAGPLPNNDEDVLIQVVRSDSSVLLSSPNLSSDEPISTLDPGFRTVDDVPGRSETFRVVSRPLAQPAGVTLLVGVNNDDVNDPISIIVRLLAVIVPTVTAALGALTWWLTGRTLRPVERMRVEMAGITSSRLDRRIAEPGTGDEIDRLAQTMNGTLDRLEEGARRQRRFVADASHELRGPLTRMRGELEIGLANGSDAELQASQASVLNEVTELQGLVDDLLELARSDAAEELSAYEPVDLDDVVFRELRRVSERGRVEIDAADVRAAQVRGDRAQLGRVVRNLLDNAERHATSVVTVALHDDGGSVTLTVQDDGRGVPADQREHIFGRFTRLDEARTRDAGGAGLGLAITRDIVERHGGTIRLADDGVSRFEVNLPASDSWSAP
jgi:signal transduction histidine kinase